MCFLVKLIQPLIAQPCPVWSKSEMTQPGGCDYPSSAPRCNICASVRNQPCPSLISNLAK
ncbi:hypothetical protein I7I53_04103 [Histoplasma capsulatum var. duboisii H88]|uniref:Uncharacterized protein n=1 Tax=Ajellomyces capsulatus (strain H88) TaxID=544711 RepID=A0A8A1LUB4_AJEC8|nr:hypothetical protein I7I53_04103 [Histoplasma capsulatum var. duboisii H88]